MILLKENLSMPGSATHARPDFLCYRKKSNFSLRVGNELKILSRPVFFFLFVTAIRTCVSIGIQKVSAVFFLYHQTAEFRRGRVS